MAGYDPKKAALFNQLIQNGLSEDAALAQAGIDDPSSYVIDEVGTPETNRNYGQLTDAGFNVPGRTGNTLSEDEIESDADVDRQFRTTVTNVQNTSNDTTTVTGGGSRTTVVQPTQFQDTDASRTAQSEADRVTAEKSALSAQLKAEGKSGAEVLRDPRYRELSAQQQSLQNEADAAKAPVPGTGSVTTTTTDASGDVTDIQTSTPDFVTANAGISDPTVQISEVDAVNPVAGPALTDAVTNDTPDPFEVDGAAQDNPIEAEIAQPVSEDPQAGGFVFDENGELIPADSAQAEIIREEETRVQNAAALAPLNYSVTFEDGFDWVIVDENGTFIETGFATQEEAANYLTDLQSSALSEQPPPPLAEVADTETTDTDAAATTQAAADRARAQAVIEAQRKQANDGDWRVKLRLAGGANYLYRDPALANPQSGILYPLSVTDGVIFPYMPVINTVYGANYNPYDLTHSNYRGYFYQNSYVDEITIQAVFTAQDTSEASYMLAVIHFFRSVTKMFYGQDSQRGTPPPLVFLQGLGEYQFNLHSCVVKSFTYNLPNDVDYIRCRSVNISGTNLQDRRDLAAQNTSPASLSNARLSAAGITPGALQQPPPPSTLGTNRPTYVPTRMESTITLLPIQTRSQVSQQFSVKQYANGDLLKGGFW